MNTTNCFPEINQKKYNNELLNNLMLALILFYILLMLKQMFNIVKKCFKKCYNKKYVNENNDIRLMNLINESFNYLYINDIIRHNNNQKRYTSENNIKIFKENIEDLKYFLDLTEEKHKNKDKIIKILNETKNKISLIDKNTAYPEALINKCLINYFKNI